MEEKNLASWEEDCILVARRCRSYKARPRIHDRGAGMQHEVDPRNRSAVIASRSLLLSPALILIRFGDEGDVAQ